MSNPEEQIYANALNLITDLGAVRLARLLSHFGSFRKAWEAGRADYVAAGFNPKLAEAIMKRKPEIDPPIEFGKLAKLGIEILLQNSPEYPDILKEISASPPLLYVRGQKEVLNTTALAVVGTRKMTTYGSQACQEITTGLVNSKLTIVSGLAFGVDAAAHKACLEAGGRAIAVLATPIDNPNISPRQNFALAQKIMETGCIISEYPVGFTVAKGNFPVRNRIISGLAVGTLVVEADVDSGSLITASFALEQNREVFAVPGSIFSQVSRGTNNLIKKGAKLVNSYMDIIEELNLDQAPVPEIELEGASSEQEQLILEKLSRDPIHIDDLVRAIDMPAAEVSAALVMLEMKGRVRNLGGAKFAKIR